MSDNGETQRMLSQESSFTVMASKKSYSQLPGTDSAYSPVVTSSLVSSGNGGAEVHYGSGGADAISLTESRDNAGSSTPGGDKVPLLSEIIEKKKKG